MPKIGQMVVYHTTEKQRENMTASRICNAQTELPAVVVAVWSEDCVNLQVIPDGDFSQALWVTSALKGASECNWEPSEN